MNILVIGKGFGANVHVPAFQSLGCEVRNVTRDWPAHLEWADAVSIAVPPSEQYWITLRAIRAGKHVLCEKPFGLNPEQAEALVAEMSERGPVGMVGYEFDELPCEVTPGRIRWHSPNWADPLRPWGWQCDRSRGGGVISAFGSHVFQWIERRCWIREVKAVLHTAIKERQGKTCTAEDCATVAVKMDSGLTWIELCQVDPFAPSVSGESVRLPAFTKLASDFLEACKIGRTLEPSFETGHRVQHIMDACYRSNGEWVKV